MPLDVEHKFLIQLRPGTYAVEIDSSHTVTTTEIPSRAAHFVYAAADKWVQLFKRRGFRQAVVTNYAGEPMTEALLKNELRAIAEAKAQDSLPKTYHDLDAIPAVEIRKRYRTEPAFVQAYEQIVATPRLPKKPKRT